MFVGFFHSTLFSTAEKETWVCPVHPLSLYTRAKIAVLSCLTIGEMIQDFSTRHVLQVAIFITNAIEPLARYGPLFNVLDIAQAYGGTNAALECSMVEHILLLLDLCDVGELLFLRSKASMLTLDLLGGTVYLHGLITVVSNVEELRDAVVETGLIDDILAIMDSGVLDEVLLAKALASLELQLSIVEVITKDCTS